MGIALIAVGVLGVGVVGARVAQSATPQGIAAAYPACATALLARSPTTQRVFTAYGTGGYVIDRLWPRASVYEYGESISLGTAVFDRLRAHRRRCHHQLRRRCSSSTRATPPRCCTAQGPLTDELGSLAGVDAIVADDHGMLLFLRGDASWADRRLLRRVCRQLTAHRDRSAGVRSATMRLIGVTGGIATGKSTVDRLLAAHGAAVIDADELAREVVRPR